MLRVMIEGRAEGGKPRGRKRMMMLDDILGEEKYHERKKIEENRELAVETTDMCWTCPRTDH